MIFAVEEAADSFKCSMEMMFRNSHTQLSDMRNLLGSSDTEYVIYRHMIKGCCSMQHLHKLCVLIALCIGGVL